MAETSYYGADLAERIGWMVRLRWVGAAGVIATVAFASKMCVKKQRLLVSRSKSTKL
jgi:hypothetical protein